MTKQQYQRILENRRRRGAQPLFETTSVARFLREAARKDRQHRRAQEALESVLPREWLELTRVHAISDGVLEVRVADPLVRERIHRQARRLQQQLSRRLPGLRRLVALRG